MYTANEYRQFAAQNVARTREELAKGAGGTSWDRLGSTVRTLARETGAYETWQELANIIADGLSSADVLMRIVAEIAARNPDDTWGSGDEVRRAYNEGRRHAVTQLLQMRDLQGWLDAQKVKA